MLNMIFPCEWEPVLIKLISHTGNIILYTLKTTSISRVAIMPILIKMAKQTNGKTKFKSRMSLDIRIFTENLIIYLTKKDKKEVAKQLMKWTGTSKLFILRIVKWGLIQVCQGCNHPFTPLPWTSMELEWKSCVDIILCSIYLSHSPRINQSFIRVSWKSSLTAR